MTQENVAEIVSEAVYEEEGRTKLACGKAFDLAAKNGVTLAEISQYCNENGIRIARCQLGCFN